MGKYFHTWANTHMNMFIACNDFVLPRERRQTWINPNVLTITWKESWNENLFSQLHMDGMTLTKFRLSESDMLSHLLSVHLEVLSNSGFSIRAQLSGSLKLAHTAVRF